MALIGQHPTEEVIEQYLFGSLSEQESEQLEEHLLICHSCIDTAEQLGDAGKRDVKDRGAHRWRGSRSFVLAAALLRFRFFRLIVSGWRYPSLMR